jgi:hypothetical protein
MRDPDKRGQALTGLSILFSHLIMPATRLKTTYLNLLNNS